MRLRALTPHAGANSSLPRNLVEGLQSQLFHPEIEDRGQGSPRRPGGRKTGQRRASYSHPRAVRNCRHRSHRAAQEAAGHRLHGARDGNRTGSRRHHRNRLPAIGWRRFSHLSRAGPALAKVHPVSLDRSGAATGPAYPPGCRGSRPPSQSGSRKRRGDLLRRGHPVAGIALSRQDPRHRRVTDWLGRQTGVLAFGRI